MAFRECNFFECQLKLGFCRFFTLREGEDRDVRNYANTNVGRDMLHVHQKKLRVGIPLYLLFFLLSNPKRWKKFIVILCNSSRAWWKENFHVRKSYHNRVENLRPNFRKLGKFELPAGINQNHTRYVVIPKLPEYCKLRIWMSNFESTLDSDEILSRKQMLRAPSNSQLM